MKRIFIIRATSQHCNIISPGKSLRCQTKLGSWLISKSSNQRVEQGYKNGFMLKVNGALQGQEEGAHKHYYSGGFRGRNLSQASHCVRAIKNSSQCLWRARLYVSFLTMTDSEIIKEFKEQ